MADDRTVLYAAPEDQPDGLAEGTTSNQDLAKPIPPGAGKGSSTPASSATKGEWVDHAVSQGADRDEAESMTKAELEEQFG